MRKDVRVIITVIAAFVAYMFLFQKYFAVFFHFVNNTISERSIAYAIAYLIVGLPIFAAVVYLKPKQFFDSLGLARSVLIAFGVAFIFTSPMLIGYFILFQFNHEISFGQIMQGVIYAAFFEELYFRAFFFGMLFRYTRIGFIPSVVIGAIVFATGHLYQSSDAKVMIGIFGVTLLGAGWFSWVYAEWRYNLWVPVFLHLLMNLYWLLFDVSDNALGSLVSNIFRMASIALVILGTLYYKKRNNLKLIVNRNTLLHRTGAIQ